MTEGYDHVRMDTWVGDVETSRCDLPSAWNEGHEQAASLLLEARIPGDSFAFQMDSTRMCAHVGLHILRASHDLVKQNLKEQVCIT